MARKRRVIDKKQSKTQNIVYIVTEGGTEKNYLYYLKNIYKCNFKLDIYPKPKLKNIKHFIKKYSENKGIDQEELILLYDLENNETEYNKFINNDKVIHPNTYLVQPCIEIHFLMHTKNEIPSKDKYIECDEVIKKLQTKLPNYVKGDSFDWAKNKVTKEQIEYAKEYSINNFESLSDKSFSMVGYLIQNHFLNKQ